MEVTVGVYGELGVADSSKVAGRTAHICDVADAFKAHFGVEGHTSIHYIHVYLVLAQIYKKVPHIGYQRLEKRLIKDRAGHA